MTKLKLHTPDLTADNITKLKALFPNCVTEAYAEDGTLKHAIDFDQLRQELSDSIVDDSKERYQLNWPGKAGAVLTANAPITKTLRPCRPDSLNFDTTQNLFIEGDNLDALKLLQETYLNKVKMIYIDPPYNTGNDFIYQDNFAEDTESYLQRSNQKDEEGSRLVANTESNGRFHSDWLTMMYPRLKLARNLLKNDGVIFISIDDNELHNLRKICNEIFGEKNFVAQFIWHSRQNVDSRSINGASIDHEYILCFSKQQGIRIRGKEINKEKYKNPDQDPRGAWMSSAMDGIATQDKRPNLHYPIINPETGITYYPSPENGWRFQKSTVASLIQENRIIWPKNPTSKPRFKRYINELQNEYTGFSTLLDTDFTLHGTKELRNLMTMETVKFPKPVSLIKTFIQQSLASQDIILDFFSGSATTAHAVMQLNAEDGGKRRFIMVQLPELCDEKSEAFKAGYKTIAEIGKERIRRAGKKIKADYADKPGIDQLDIGFRVLKVDSSNMKDVYYTPDAIQQRELFTQVNNIHEDRSAEDLLFQVMLDWGLDLAYPIMQEIIAGKTVFFVAGDSLAACFETDINEAFVKELATRKPMRVVFRDASFSSDSAKINVEQIFRLLSENTEVRTI